MPTKKTNFLHIARIETPYNKTRIIKTPQESITIYAIDVHHRLKKRNTNMRATILADIKRKTKIFSVKIS